MLFPDPMDFTWTTGPAGASVGQHPRASRYRYQYAVHTVTRLLFFLIGA